MAPVSPFFADRLYRDLTHSTTSVHLADYPKADNSRIDRALEERMQLAQTVTSMTLALRRKQNIKVRQPLTAIMVPVNDARQREALLAVSDLVKSEVNVKEIKIVDNNEGVLVKRVKPDFKKLGPKFGKNMKAVAQYLTTMAQPDILAFEHDGSTTVQLDGAECVIDVADVEIISQDIPGWLVANEGSITVALDITVTDALRNEGMARELVNRIQNIRKNKGFEITDRIRVVINPDARVEAALKDFADYIAQQVLAVDLAMRPVVRDDMVDAANDDLNVSIEVDRV